jgi:hypothetical protein
MRSLSLRLRGEQNERRQDDDEQRPATPPRHRLKTAGVASWFRALGIFEGTRIEVISIAASLR